MLISVIVKQNKSNKKIKKHHIAINNYLIKCILLTFFMILLSKQKIFNNKFCQNICVCKQQFFRK